MISPEEVREVQKALTDRGLYADAVDGIMGPKTVAALKAFQAAEGLAQTGYLDRESRTKLGLQAPGTQAPAARAPAAQAPAAQAPATK